MFWWFITHLALMQNGMIVGQRIHLAGPQTQSDLTWTKPQFRQIWTGPNDFINCCTPLNLGLDHWFSSAPCLNFELDFGQVLKGLGPNHSSEMNLGISTTTPALSSKIRSTVQSLGNDWCKNQGTLKGRKRDRFWVLIWHARDRHQMDNVIAEEMLIRDLAW